MGYLYLFSADIVEKEFDGRQSVDASNRLAAPYGRPGERSYDHRNFDFGRNFDRRDREFNIDGDYDDVVVSSGFRERHMDDRFRDGQRENFANLYISEPPNDADEQVVYSEVDRFRHKHQTSVEGSPLSSAGPAQYEISVVCTT